MKSKNRTEVGSKQEMRQELRVGERISAAHAVSVGNTKGVTSDISASGVYFISDVTFALGEIISFVVEIGRASINFILKCVGEIVRIEHRDGKIGVGVRISESVMEPA